MDADERGWPDELAGMRISLLPSYDDSMIEPFNGIRFDKTALAVRGLHDPDDSHKYWWSKSPQERLQALEYLRYHAYGYDPLTDSIPRVLTVVESSER